MRGAEWEGVRGVRWAGGGRGGEWLELFTSITTACFKREPTSLSSRDRERGREGAGGSEGGREGGREGERGGEVSLGMMC